MMFIMGLIIFAFLYMPLLLIVLAIKGHNAKTKAKRLRSERIEDMKTALAAPPTYTTGQPIP